MPLLAQEEHKRTTRTRKVAVAVRNSPFAVRSIFRSAQCAVCRQARRSAAFFQRQESDNESEGGRTEKNKESD